MSRLRLFIFWIVCVCVPLQGHAAAAMALCGAGHAGDGASAVISMRADAVESRAIDAVTAVAVAVEQPAQGHAAHPCHDGVAHADMHTDLHDGADPGASADAAHACGTCAACHAAALTGRLDVALLHDLPAADLAEPAPVPATRVPRVLDRPPGA